jgi:hypothetical protein
LENCIGIVTNFKLFIKVKRPAFAISGLFSEKEEKIVKDDFTCYFRFDGESGNIILTFNYPFTLTTSRR